MSEGDDGSIHVGHHVTPADGGYAKEVDVNFSREYFRTHTPEDFYANIVERNTRIPMFNKEEEEKQLLDIHRLFRDISWLPKFQKINTDKKIYYRHAELIEKQMNDVDRISVRQDGDKYLYIDSNHHAKFIIHERKLTAHDAPLERILLLPDTEDYLPRIYERDHQAEYSRWYEMTYDDGL